MGRRLTRALGQHPMLEVDVIIGRPRVGDKYLLCSDGLNKMVPDDEIAGVLKKDAPPQEIVDELLQLALEAGGRDNVTAIVVFIESIAEKITRERKKKNSRERADRKVA